MNPSAYEGGFDCALPVGGPVALDARTVTGVIRIIGGAPGCVRVRGILRSKRSIFWTGDVMERIRQLEASPPIEQRGDSIRVGYAEDHWMMRGILLLFEITVPPDTAVRTRAESGDIHVEGVRGSFDCQADAGQVEILACQGRARVKVDAGGIHVRNLNGSVQAEADSGEIEALEIAGAIDVRTDSGSIRLSQTVPAPVRAEADSGSIRLRLAPDAGYNVRAKTDSGDIRMPQVAALEVSSNRVMGQIRGGGPMIELAVDSGSIEIE
jgi:Toastrack DUF4097